ncbi:MAG: saccharopine dehydrogenase NADP-binding domain-containing protein [Pseudomonadales bacterium]|nr:saccharopine dehydrogenase NADP-binding domain-containing protein [Pseudomonadales bacterium]
MKDKLYSVIVIGGYGTFGQRLVKSLSENPGLMITIAGRNTEKASVLADALKKEKSKACIRFARIDTTSAELQADIKQLEADCIVNCSGPFLLECDQLRQCCVDLQCNYIDLADNRQFVNAIENYDVGAKVANVCLISGASTVPGLSTAVIEHFLPRFATLTSINYGISPGNKTERGLATVSSILSYTGKPYTHLKDGMQQVCFGWQGLRRYDFGPVLGKRWLSNCDIPDHDILPKRYPQLQQLQFQAGLEVTLLHVGLWLLSLLPRLGLLKSLMPFATPLTAMSKWFQTLGSDAGGMFMHLQGIDHDGQTLNIEWCMEAEDGVGPNIPTIAAEILVTRLAGSNTLPAGAYACVDLFSLEEFMQVAKRWGIVHYTR